MTSNPIISDNSSAMSSGRYSPIAGRPWRLPSARSHALSSWRCLMDRTTEGLALSNSIRNLTELDDVAGRNTAGRAMKQVAVDHRAQFRSRQRIIAAHQILDFKPTILADGFQRRDHVADMAALR